MRLHGTPRSSANNPPFLTTIVRALLKEIGRRMPVSAAFDQTRYCQLEQLPAGVLLFLAYNQPRYKHRERPVVNRRDLTDPGLLTFRVEHYEKADPHT